MSQFQVIVNQIIVLGVLVVIGFAAVKVKAIDEGINNSLAKIIVKITLPLLILTSISNLDMTADMLKNGIAVLITAYFSLLLLFVCGVITAKLLHLKGITKNVYIAHMIFGNVIFLGFPLFQALYPNGEGIFYAVLFHVASDSLLWTLGVYLLSKHDNSGSNSSIKHMINPNTIAFLTGSVMLVLGIRLPDTVNKAFSGLGQTTIYLSMLFIGAALAGISLKEIYKKHSLLVLNIFKMVLIPLGVAVLLNWLNHLFSLGIGDAAKTVVVLQAAMPAMATVAVLAKNFKSDYVYAAENVFVSTVLSLGTLPLVFYLTGLL